MAYRPPSLDLRAYRPRQSATRLLTQKFCEEHFVIPVNAVGGALIIAMLNPDDQSTIDEVRMLTRLKIEVVCASAEEITDSIARCYGQPS